MKKLHQIPKRKKEADKNFLNVINVKKPGMIFDLSKFIKLSQENVQENLGLRHSSYIRTISHYLFVEMVQIGSWTVWAEEYAFLRKIQNCISVETC